MVFGELSPKFHIAWKMDFTKSQSLGKEKRMKEMECRIQLSGWEDGPKNALGVSRYQFNTNFILDVIYILKELEETVI